MNLETVETPAAVVDLVRARANVRRVADYCSAHGLAWRPHVKTHKSLRFARMQIEAGAVGVSVATPFEAEVMSSVTDDVLLAYPPVGQARLDRLMALPERVRLGVALDSLDVLEPLARAAARAGRTVRVLVEMDVGARRVGVPTAREALDLARAASELEGVRYGGLAFYPGHLRFHAAEQDEGLAELGGVLSEAIDLLASEGLKPPVVSGGSTPTLFRSHEIAGLTEIRPGTCVFHDRDTVAMGAAELPDVAYTVLATVVSTAVPGRAAIDAGSKALSKEAIRSGGGGYGVLLEHPSVRLESLSEEHGVLDLSETDWRPRVGDRVRVVPNHVCLSVNLQDRYLVDVDGTLEAWPIDARGRAAEPRVGAVAGGP